MRKGFFVTATGTDAGKTVFTAGGLAMLLEKGVDAAPVKAVQTGMENSKISPDLKVIFSLSGFKPAEKEIGFMQPFTYLKPCSPHLAAELDNKRPAAVDGIEKAVEKLYKSHEAVVVEGAGGLLVPVDRKKRIYMADIIKALDLPVILVSPSGLGAVSSCCLNIEALKSRGIKIAGFVLNDIGPKSRDGYIEKDNARVIREFSGAGYLGTLARIKNMNRKNLLKACSSMDGLKKLIDGV